VGWSGCIDWGLKLKCALPQMARWRLRRRRHLRRRVKCLLFSFEAPVRSCWSRKRRMRAEAIGILDYRNRCWCWMQSLNVRMRMRSGVWR
jgi:hypothetical protein